MKPLKAFISYSHQDTPILEVLHKHLTQLQREGLIETWEDQEIQAGGTLEQEISKALKGSGLFIAMLSPDYIASRYCYEKEFQMALQLQENGQLIIVPIIAEPCDWLNTPFSKFKALPKDGKAISTWENRNTAFLDVAQNVRKLVQVGQGAQETIQSTAIGMSRNYRVQKDFDSIERLEFLEKSFHEVIDIIKRYIDEIVQLDNIKVRVLHDSGNSFKAMLVNRNKIASESQLTITTADSNQSVGLIHLEDKLISYSIGGKNNSNQKGFKLAFDDYQMFWIESNFFSNRSGQAKLTSKEIAEAIWNEWLSNVGIL